MGNVNWVDSQGFQARKRALIDANANGNSWLGFLDALGYMESTNSYSAQNGIYNGKYQCWC